MSSHFPTDIVTSKQNNSHVGSPSPRKKRNNSTPSRKDAAEKKKILQQLISPNANSKVTLGELIQLSENDDAAHNNLASHSSENNFKETAFIERPPSTNAVGQQPRKLMRQVSSDPKLEKKVTFARLLSKMSAEINVGSDVDGNNHSSALSLPTDVQLRANSVPQSPCTNDIRSPHSTSSNQGSDSLSSSELALHEFNLKNNSRKNRPKVSSADSILAMFRNFASSNVGLNLPASLIFSPSSSTPTASSPQDDMGDDESSTSSVPTPVSFSSGAPDSPVFYRQSTIEVPVMDAISAHKTTPAQNLLHPPTILLEIPGNITKCLSPIKEMPTPMPSPALTPIMPRPQRLTKSSNVRDFAFSDDDDKNHYLASNPKFTGDISSEMKMRDSDNDSIAVYTTLCESSDNSSRKSKFVSVPTISIDINPPTPDERAEKRSPQRPKDLIIPELVVQTPSPTKERYPVTIIPGSPPPQRARASIGETSSLFPDKQQQKRLLMQFDKPGSLDFPFVPPMITITANMSEVESDTEFLSPVTSKALLLPIKLIPNTSGMTYLSPFSMCTRGDRAPSEGNLSSSGYSSMASPGPSRCGSNSKLCANEMDSTVASLTPSSSHPRRFQSILKKPDENERNAGKDGNGYFRKRSDSETLSDETLLESNDEGIGTDHIDEKIEDGDIKSARDLEVFIGKELLETGKSLMSIDEQPMAQLQLPSIVIQSEFGFDKLSPVSSRSESPLSDRNIGMAKFSPQFFGKKDQQLPFTDSDGLYDFPSSDGKGGSGTTHIRKSLGKRKERRSSKTAILSASPSKSTASNEKLSDHLEIPAKGIQSTSSKHYASSSFVRKSPKRRSYRYTPSSSSSTESLTANSCAKEMPSIKLRDSLIENIEMKHSKNVPDESSLYGQASEKRSCGSQPIKKVSRMKAIGHQIRFLRRLDKALKEREKSKYISDVDEDSDFPDSTKASTPLLQSCSKDSNKTNQSRFSRQKKVGNTYVFENDAKDRDYSS